jgi:diphthamide synthase (EF-2-diphthine--ammonia ligase)
VQNLKETHHKRKCLSSRDRVCSGWDVSGYEPPQKMLKEQLAQEKGLIFINPLWLKSQEDITVLTN